MTQQRHTIATTGDARQPSLLAHPMQRETKYAKSGNVHIAYQVAGDGPINLVFVMGWISHLEHLWEGPGARFLTRLASFSRLITFDKRGTGLSDRTGELPTIEQRMDDVRAVMDAAGADRAALMGISEGAAMCAVFAATYPERTAGLVMYGAYAKREWHPDYPWAPTADQRQKFYEAIEQGWGGVVDLDTLAPSTAGDEPFRQWWARYLRQSASPGSAIALARMNTAIDIRHVLPAIRTPTLILHRTGDLDIDVGGARYLAGHIPGARYVELPGDDHLVFAGDQEAVLAEVEQFLTGVRPIQDPDRFLATILYTEIVEAVVVAARIGAVPWQHTLNTFELLATEELVRYRGQRVRRTASGFVAVFDGPARALHCATALVAQALALGLDLRAGLHCGECERVGDDIRGSAVQIAARVMTRASAGNVLVSSTITDLVAGSGFQFEPLHQRLVAGTDRALDLFRVITGTPSANEPVTPSDQRSSEGIQLSRREREVATLIARGLSNREIANDLSISIATVERHAANIFNKLGLRSRTQVAAWVANEGLLRTQSR
jgi:pimeloyl-ACP methyl ester carboxylesterase/DNA-binding CsgD family transcriptional regulator